MARGAAVAMVLAAAVRAGCAMLVTRMGHLASIREEGEGRTVLLVSHRPSTMRIADTVVPVENGRMS